MKRSRLKETYAVIATSAGIICAHAVLNTVFQSHGFAISYLLWTVWALLAALACLWRAFHCPLSIRAHWRLAAASLFFIYIAAAVEAPAEIFFRAVPTVASIGDFFFFASFVPILLSITLPDEGALDRSPFLLDSFQAAACTCLAYTALFGAFPFIGQPASAMPYAPLEYVYDAEYLAVVLLAALRLFLGTRHKPDRYFFRSLLLYTSLYAFCSGIYNHYVGKYSLTNGLDALNDIPSAALALAALFAPAAAPLADSGLASAVGRPKLVRLIDNARPVFLSLALIGLSAIVAVRHFAVAFGFIVLAFILYSLRASLLQSKLQHAQAALQQSNTRLSEIAHLDSLTGVPNRRGFDQLFAIEWGRAQRTRQPLSMLLIDVDHFKRINDTYGHQAGDECLRNTARVLSATLDRPADLIARYGGDEFAILLAETGPLGASTVAARMRSAIANDAKAPVPTTLSIGVCTWNAEGDASQNQLISAADRALYAAKRNGRDRIELIDLHSLAVS
ncbi:MAG: GGDEF domain-containing protein [Terracidiphilus sp.]